MNRILLESRFTGIELVHVDASFSRQMSDMRSVAWRKLWKLFWLPARIIVAKFRSGSDILLYSPSGPTRSAAIKDAWILGLSRPFFRTTVFHVHASGIGDYLKATRTTWAGIARHALYHPTWLIRLSPATPRDDIALIARHTASIPNCIRDEAELLAIHRTATVDGPLRILFVGLHIPSKGLRILLDAIIELKREGIIVYIETLGSFSDPVFANECRETIQTENLNEHFRFLGPVFGAQKIGAFARADLMVFPTYFDSETLPLVVIEAMAAGLPVISTRWRGIQDLIDDGRTGFLIEPRQTAPVITAIKTIHLDRNLIRAMGDAARERFKQNYSQAAFRSAWQKTLLAIVNTP
ncbi:MAG: glycosyltransferase [Verrucomicrobia bacterium]|nr:glycosyltransferase [Verrucomicrobiota bacterium]